MTAIRIRCIVPHCNRTRGQRKGEEPIREGEEWICGKHWRPVDRSTKRVQNRINRLIARAVATEPLVRSYWHLPPGSPQRLLAVALWQRQRRIWSRCKAKAIEIAMGIS